MNKFTTLVFCLLLSFGASFAQRIDYDNSSKWFLGFNLGGTWQTTDVQNKTNVGYGLTLGKSFNYDYGRKLTFDLRARYLRGFWYGQDYDTTSLASYAGSALNNYKDSLGFSVNNFQADVYRLGFELVIHANGIRERTGWDPYIFGGVGFTWHQTNGNLYNNDSLGTLYNYDPSILNNSYLNSTLDAIYDSPLDGSKKDVFRVGFMPSLGFGLGYQVGKRVSIGLEHKSTFTLIDDFDGYVAPSKYRDIYHYTSAYIQFRFRTGDAERTGGSNLNNVENYNQNNAGGCVTPKIKFITPENSQISTLQMQYVVVAEIKDVLGRDNISFSHNGVNAANFTYNPTSDRLECSLVLTPGINTFEIRATNTCGVDIQTTNLSYTCIPPAITLTNPSVNGTTVRSANFTLSAIIQNAVSTQNITVSQNNFVLSSGNFNAATNQYENNVTLVNGTNIFVITATNACGTDAKTITIIYDNCLLPSINVISPAANGTTVTNANYALTAAIQNMSSKQGISITQNGRAITNLTFNTTTGAFQSSVVLTPGTNTFLLSATNSCGTDTETITILYSNCIPPSISIVSPATNGSNVTTAAFTFTATILNSNNGQGIGFTQNGRAINGVNFNTTNNTLSTSVILVPGVNTFVVTATNSCGTDTETITVTYQPCVAPVISILAPVSNGTTVTTAAFIFTATILNSNNGQGIGFTQNGRAINGVNFNTVNNTLSTSLTLVPGVNTFVVTATNSCGTDTETITIVYSNCIPPSISIVSPATNESTVINASFPFSAFIQNSNNGQGINFTQNGAAVSNASFNISTGSLQKTVTLLPGINTFVITATNSCGTDTEIITINFQSCLPPAITLVSPLTSGITVNSASFAFTAFIQNSNNGQGVTLLQNGRAITNYSFNNATGSIQSALTLSAGVNTLVLSATNSCGTDSETITITYDNCIAPTINMIDPPAIGANVINANFSISALILNSNNGQGITLTHNGRTINNFSFNNGTSTLQSNLTLVPGVNTFVVTATNSCGTDTETITITYQPCVAPVISILAPASNGTTITNAAFTFTATILNSNNGQGIGFTQNGRAISGVNFNTANNTLSTGVTLVPGVNTFVIVATNSCGTDSETITITYQPCVAPVISILAPASNGTTVTNAAFTFTATILNSNNGQGIGFTQNGRAINGVNFNTANNTLSTGVTLVPGVNTFVIVATNSCGTDTETITILYSNCIPPSISIVSPATNGTTVTNAAFTFTATILNSNNGQGIGFTQNGRAINGVNFNTANNTLSTGVTLVPGVNTFVIVATNSCGTDTETITITYQPCVAPVISILAPASNGTTVANAAFTFTATILNSNNGQGIGFTQNGRAISGVNFNTANNTLSTGVTLVPGVNTFIIVATNSCGTDTETITITYQPCVAPVISILAPASNGTTITNAVFTFTATILNSNNGQGIGFTQNGRAINGVNFNTANNTLSTSVTLVPGVNTFVVTATNSCGTDTETITITYQPCVAPVILILAPASNGTTVATAAFTFTATILNSNNGQGIGFTQNGRAINGVNFNTANNTLSTGVTLVPGVNTFVVTATNSCGTDTETITITYQPCVAPVISILAPASNGTTVATAAFTFTATILNSNNGQGIGFTQNGRAINGVNFNTANNTLSTGVTLVPGVNTFVVTATNSCGTDTETISITYQPCVAPVISILAPASNGTTVATAAFTFTATILNSNNGQGIGFTQNGRAINGVNFNTANNTLSTGVTLVPGVNTFVVTATNSCGTDTETITINYVPQTEDKKPSPGKQGPIAPGTGRGGK